MSPEVVQEIIAIFLAFTKILSSAPVYELSRTKAGDFTRARGSLQLPRLLQYVIFRNCKDTSSELSRFYASINATRERPSRQATNKRLRCLNNQVWSYLSMEFSKLFYQSKHIVRKLNEYVVWAADSSAFEMPYSEEAALKYGIHRSNHVKKASDSGKIIVRCGGLYDVINRLFVDYIIKPYKDSELSILTEQLRRFSPFLKKHKIILLADRGYISMSLMALADILGYKYCIRAKRNTYKAEVGRMHSDDEYIQIRLNKSVFSRISDATVVEYLKNRAVYSVRVVKTYWKNPDTGSVQMYIYFTNLEKSEFDSHNIVALYEGRWNVEVAYETLKVVLELERHVSLVPEIAFNMLYGKIMFYNFSAIFREQLEMLISNEDQRFASSKSKKEKRENKYPYQINMKALIFHLYSEQLVRCLSIKENIDDLLRKIIDDLVSLLNKFKTPIRKDRHYERWGKAVSSSCRYKFKIDGRNHPKVAIVRGIMRTVRP